MKFAFLLASAALAAQAPATPVAATNPAVAAGEPGLVGTWKLDRFENRLKDGTIVRPYGEHPRGYFVYDATGHVHIQVMRNPPPAHFASGDEEKPTSEETLKLYSTYVAYFGTYRVDKEKGLLTHVVEGSLNPFYTDTDQLRPYKLKGDTFIIEADDPESGTHFYRELHRVL